MRRGAGEGSNRQTGGARRLAVVALVAAAIAGAALAALAQAPSPQGPPQQTPPIPIPPGALPATGAPAPPGDTVRIVFLTVPMKKAMVFWGKKRLGVIAPHAPLTVQRPRDSGPLDVVVRADGYVSVQTRAYTFADNKVAVKLTPIDQKNTLLGYREELPPAADGGLPSSRADGGAPLPPLPRGIAAPDGGAR